MPFLRPIAKKVVKLQEIAVQCGSATAKKVEWRGKGAALVDGQTRSSKESRRPVRPC